jgi:hypothetical protein
MEATLDGASRYPDGGSDLRFVHSLEVPQENHGTSGLGELVERRFEIAVPHQFVLAPPGWLHWLGQMVVVLEARSGRMGQAPGTVASQVDGDSEKPGLEIPARIEAST